MTMHEYSNRERIPAAALAEAVNVPSAEHAPAVSRESAAAIGGCSLKDFKIENGGRTVEVTIINGKPAPVHAVDPWYNDGSIRTLYTFTSGQDTLPQKVTGNRDPESDFYGRAAEVAEYTLPETGVPDGAMVFVDGLNVTAGPVQIQHGMPENCGGFYVTNTPSGLEVGPVDG